jgi:hypothetical protein
MDCRDAIMSVDSGKGVAKAAKISSCVTVKSSSKRGCALNGGRFAGCVATAIGSAEI